MRNLICVILAWVLIGCNSEILVETTTTVVESNIQTETPITPVFGKLVAGGEHTCYLNDLGKVYCWGKNTFGQLGIGHEDSVGDDETYESFVNAELGFNVNSKLFIGAYHGCVIDNGKNLKCWGAAANGRSGHMTHANGLNDNMDIGDDENPSVFASSNFGIDVKIVAPAGVNSCVLLADGNVRCWGSGIDGSLGNNSTSNQRYYEDAGNLDLNLAPGEVINDIKGRGQHYCVVTNLGNVKCWGSAYKGMLGYGNLNNIGDDEDTSALSNISLGTRKATQIEVSNVSTCSIFDDGSAKCWGRNSEGQLGLGHSNDIGDDELIPTNSFIRFDKKIVQIAPGNHHTCALLENGDIHCWGRGNIGQRGDANASELLIGDDEDISHFPLIDIGGKAIAITSGYHHSCALREDKLIYCWGSGSNGKLGTGNINNIGDDEYPVSSNPLSFD